jgi:Na+-translocating ferredoxin:NAD+ oxidoreductase RnfG subunit
MWKRNLIILLALSIAICASRPSLATVFYSKEEAFELAFGAGAGVETLPVFLTDEQINEVEHTAKVKLESKLFTFYQGKNRDQIVGYAALESHTVRTQAETILIVLSPDGELIRVEMLAFHEPPEYQPPAHWFEKLYRRKPAEFYLNQGVDGISGATLSSRAALDSVRKVMSIFQVSLRARGP